MLVSSNEKLQQNFENFQATRNISDTLKANPKDLTKLFCEISTNSTYRQNVSDTEYTQIFEELRLLAFSGELKSSLAAKIYRAIGFRNLGVLKNAIITFMIGTYILEGPALPWILKSQMLKGSLSNLNFTESGTYQFDFSRSFTLPVFQKIKKYVEDDDKNLKVTSFEEAFMFYKGVDYLNIDEMLPLCDQFLSSHLSEKNLTQALNMCNLFNLEGLSSTCTSYLLNKGIILKSSGKNIKISFKNYCEATIYPLVKKTIKSSFFKIIDITDLLHKCALSHNITIWDKFSKLFKRRASRIAIKFSYSKSLNSYYPYFPLITDLTIYGKSSETSTVLDHTPNLKTLEGHFSDKLLKKLPQLKNLHKLSLKFTSFNADKTTIEGIQELHKINKLKNLKLDGPGLNNRLVLKNLVYIQTLQKITLYRANESFFDEYKNLFDHLPLLRNVNFIFDKHTNILDAATTYFGSNQYLVKRINNIDKFEIIRTDRHRGVKRRYELEESILEEVGEGKGTDGEEKEKEEIEEPKSKKLKK